MRKSFSEFELARFCKQLSSLLRAGIPIRKALQVVSCQLSMGILGKIEEGQPFSDALAGKVSIDLVSLIRIGEQNGELEDALDKVSSHLYTKLETRNKIKRSLTYPAIVLCISLLCVAFLFTFILPALRICLKGLITRSRS